MKRLLRFAGAGLFATACAIAGQAGGEVTAIVGATLFDGSGAPPVPDAAVMVRDQRIVAAGPADRIEIPVDAELVNAAGKWIMPGLIDAHVHFFQSGGLYTRPDVIDLRRIRPYAQEIATIRRQLPATLAHYLTSGITSVVDLAGPAWTYDLRRLATGTAASPRVVLTGPGIAPGLPRGLDGSDAPAVVVRTPTEARRAVRSLAARSPDLLKIWFAAEPGIHLTQEFVWVQAAVEEADKTGLRVAAHATRLEIARRMVEAGADILVHSVDDQPLDADLLRQMRTENVIYIPTLGVGPRYAEVLGRQLELSPHERAMGDAGIIASLDDMARLFGRRGNRHSLPDNRTAGDNLLRVQQAGITIAAGSDAGNIGSLHGPALHRELELMEEAGLTPREVLLAATRGGAAVMGRSNELVRLAPGMLADLLVLEASPLADIRNTRRIALVMVNGRIAHCEREALAGCPD